MIKAAVFDLDHTLFDRYATIRKIISQIDYSELPFKESLSREEIADHIEYGDRNFTHISFARVVQYFAEQGILKDGITHEGFYKKYIAPQHKKFAVPFEFSMPMLEQLRRKGIKLGLITNGYGEVQYSKIRLLGYENIFDHILVGEDYGKPKPDTAIFYEMARLMDLKPEEMLYIGDNPINDVEASRNAGYIPVWVRTTGTWVYPDIEKPELQVDTVAEIPSLIDKLNG